MILIDVVVRERNDRSNLKKMMKRKLHIAIILTLSLVWLILLQAVSLGSGNVYYVRSDATGNNDGSDWTNAYTELPDPLERGATYYIADGTYGGYIFDDPEQYDNQSNPLYIYIKKAIESDHGTNDGWHPSYGDGVALFTSSANPEEGIIWFVTSYYVFDGQVGGGPGSWKTGHGFKINSSAPVGVGDKYWYVYLISLCHWGTDAPDFLKISHVELEHRGVDTGNVDCGIYHNITPNDAINKTTGEILKGRPGPSNVTIDHCYLHDFGWAPIQTIQVSNWLVEYNYIARCSSGRDGPNAEAWQDFGSDDMTIRYNIWEDIEGTAVIAHKHDILANPLPPGGDESYFINENWYVYGNIFFYSPDNPYGRTGTGHGIIGSTAWNDAPSNNILFYNNVIVNWPGWNSGARFEHGNGIKIYNNIWYNCRNYINPAPPPYSNGANVRMMGEVEYDYNIYSDSELSFTSPADNDEITSGDPFIDWQNLDFRLNPATQAGQLAIDSGLDLGAPYNIDMDGNIRGQNGFWDIGAYEYVLAQDELADKPDKTKLECYNNVFNPTKGEEALIWIELPNQAHIRLDLYNTRGNRIKELADEEKEADTHWYYWDGRNDSGSVVGSGLYFVHIQAGDYRKTKKIVVVK